MMSEQSQSLPFNINYNLFHFHKEMGLVTGVVCVCARKKKSIFHNNNNVDFNTCILYPNLFKNFISDCWTLVRKRVCWLEKSRLKIIMIVWVSNSHIWICIRYSSFSVWQQNIWSYCLLPPILPPPLTKGERTKLAPWFYFLTPGNIYLKHI